MTKFSERQGFSAPKVGLQTAGIDDDLRVSLWNALMLALFGTSRFLHGNGAEIRPFATRLWFNFFKKPVNSIPLANEWLIDEIKTYFFKCRWYEVYDFLEWVLRDQRDPRLEALIDQVIQRELGGYRYVADCFVPITSDTEIAELRAALSDEDPFVGARQHLSAALRFLSDRDAPDYRNSIKESISAVESIAAAITGKEKATLGQALVELERNGALHSALKSSFSALYGYTSDEGGIRHAMQDAPNLTVADAKYFLLACTSFVNYLKAKAEMTRDRPTG